MLQQLTAIVKLKPSNTPRTDLRKPKAVCDAVAKRITPKTLGTNLHAICAVEYGARPEAGSKNLGQTNPDWCVYEPLNGNYGFTQAWIDHLAQKLGDEQEYERMRAKLRGRRTVNRREDTALPF
jgi:hypothetical protein